MTNPTWNPQTEADVAQGAAALLQEAKGGRLPWLTDMNAYLLAKRGLEAALVSDPGMERETTRRLAAAKEEAWARFSATGKTTGGEG